MNSLKQFHLQKIGLCDNSSYSYPNFPAFGLNTERYGVSIRIQFECRKIQTRITPNTDTFYAVFGTSLIFIESCFTFLFKVYISRTWNILPTSKRELFVTISICKVIFWRLMIFYTQSCPMNVFICVSFLLVLFCFRWFQLQTSEIMLLVKITIANVALYC